MSHGKSKYPPAIANAVITPTWQTWIESFLRHVAARNRNDTTLRAYHEALANFGRYLASQDRATDVATITSRDVEAFVLLTKGTHSAYSLRLYFVALRLFFAWLLEEEELQVSPMAKMKLPELPESTRGSLRAEEVRRLLKACDGNDVAERRDLALIRLFLDTGLRLSELALIRLGDVDFHENTIAVLGKGSRPRIVPFGRKSAAALDRYLRARSRLPQAEATDRVWLGQRGPITPATARSFVIRRAEAAGIAQHIHPHLLRHTFAHFWLDGDGQEGDLRAIGGWRSDVMWRYGKNLAQDRAREAHRRHSPGDRF